MKKTILGIILTVALLVAMVGNVNAASLKVNSDKIKAGENVVVTITTKEKIQATDFELKYEPDVFEFVSHSTDLKATPTVNTDTKGSVIYVIADPDNYGNKVSFTFKALKDLDKDTKSAFEVVSDFVNDASEELENTKVEVTVTKASTPTKPDQKPDDQPKPSDPADEKDPENGEEYKQTGAPVYAGVIAVIVIAGVALFIRKAR